MNACFVLIMCLPDAASPCLAASVFKFIFLHFDIILSRARFEFSAYVQALEVFFEGCFFPLP